MAPQHVNDFFAAVAEQKPFVRSLSWVERLIRVLMAVAVAVVAWLNGPAYWLFAVAAVILFSAVYDRCPVYKVLRLQVKSWLKGKKTPAS
jgi:thioredoxin 1